MAGIFSAMCAAVAATWADNDLRGRPQAAWPALDLRAVKTKPNILWANWRAECRRWIMPRRAPMWLPATKAKTRLDKRYYCREGRTILDSARGNIGMQPQKAAFFQAGSFSKRSLHVAIWKAAYHLQFIGDGANLY